MQDIDTLLTEERHHARPNHHILDSPVPQTPHHPLKPSPVQSPPPRPNSYAFENADQQTKRPAGSMRQSKSLGDKLIDIDDERVTQDKTSQPRAGHPPSVGGQRKKVTHA